MYQLKKEIKKYKVNRVKFTNLDKEYSIMEWNGNKKKS